MFPNENAYDHIIGPAATRHAVPVALIKAIIGAESGFRSAVSSSSSYGLMQLYPPTAQMFVPGVTGGQLATDPTLNVDIGTAYLRRLLNQFGGDIAAVASGYNAGAGNAKRWTQDGRFCMEWKGGVKPPNANLDRDCQRIVAVKAGTFPNQVYVDKVLALVDYFQRQQPPGTPPVVRTPVGVTPPSPGFLAALVGLLVTLLGLRWRRKRRPSA